MAESKRDAAKADDKDAAKILSLLSGNPSRHACQKKLISEVKGYGLVATRDLERGEAIMSEPVFIIEETLNTMNSVDEYNHMIGQELKSMGSDFIHDFFRLPAYSKEMYGHIGAHFERCAVACPNAVTGGDSSIRALGIKLAWVNHGCIPNAQHSLVEEVKKSDDGVRYSICIRAVTQISKGEEITVPYEHLFMEADLRLCHMQHRFGFQCVCKACLYPDEVVEGHLAFIHANLPYICDPKYYGEHPVNALKATRAVVMAAFDADLLDSRYARIMEQAAEICAYHSDYGRAQAFVETAQAFCFVVEGFHTPNMERLLIYEEDPKLMPESGRTTIGYSTKAEVSKIKRLDLQGLELACMIDATEYVRLCDLEDRKLPEPEAPSSKPQEVAASDWDDRSSTVKGDTAQKDDAAQSEDKGKQRATSPKELDQKDLDVLMKELQLEKTDHDQKRHKSAKRVGKKARRIRKAKEKSESKSVESEDKQDSDAEDTPQVAESSKEAAKREESTFLKPTSLSWADMDSEEDGVWQTVPSRKTRKPKGKRRR